MKKSKTIGALFGAMAIAVLTLAFLVIPSAAADDVHQVTENLTVHIGVPFEKHYDCPLDVALEPVAKDATVVEVKQGVVQAATGSAVKAGMVKNTQVFYTGLKAGTTTVDLKLATTKQVVKTIKVTVEDHKWSNEYTIDEDATCTEPGRESIHCTVDDCDAIKPGSEREIPALGHFWADIPTTDVEPTYFKEGSESIHCKRCDEINPDSIEAIPKLKLRKAKIKSVKNSQKGIVKVTMKMMEGPSGFDYCYSKNANFKKAKTVYSRNTHLKISNATVGKTYYFRVRAVLKKGGKTAKGAWSAVKSVTVSK